MSPRRVAFVPGALALLSRYAGAQDPIAPMRAAVHEAVQWLGDPRPGVMYAPLSRADLDRRVIEPAGVRIARELLGAAPLTPSADKPLLVIADGTARRTEQSPGPFDPRSVGYDDVIDAALRSGDRAALAAMDVELAQELWCQGAPVFARAAESVGEVLDVEVSYADAPYGVQYWVVTWLCAS